MSREGGCPWDGAARGFPFVIDACSARPVKLPAIRFVFRSRFTLFREVMMNSYQLTLCRSS